MLPDFNFFCKLKKTNICLWLGSLQRLLCRFGPHETSKKEPHVPCYMIMWTTFSKSAKISLGRGSHFNLDNAQKIGCFFGNHPHCRGNYFWSRFSCQRSHRTLVFTNKRWNILVSQSPSNVLNILHPRGVSTPYPVTASYQQSDGMQHQQCTKEMGASMTLHTFMPQHLLLLMMRCAFSWGKISCGFTPMHRGINQLISHRMVMNKRKLVWWG